MTIQIAITPPLAGINADKLRAELVAVYPDVTGISVAKGNYYVNLIDDSPITQQQLQAVVDLHNPAILTPAQQTATEDTSARANLLALAESALTQIAADRAAIAQGKVALATATTLGQVKPVMDGVLDRLDNVCNRQDREIRALRAMLRNGLGSG
jgi:hypothetical protein